MLLEFLKPLITIGIAVVAGHVVVGQVIEIWRTIVVGVVLVNVQGIFTERASVHVGTRVTPS